MVGAYLTHPISPGAATFRSQAPGGTQNGPSPSSRFACEQSSQDGGHPPGDRILGVLKPCFSPALAGRELCSRTPKRRSAPYTLKWR